MKNRKMIDEMIGMAYQNQTIYQCISKNVEIHPERIQILYHIVINYDEMRLEELLSEVYRYGSMIMQDDLLARQIFQILICLAKEKKNND